MSDINPIYQHQRQRFEKHQNIHRRRVLWVSPEVIAMLMSNRKLSHEYFFRSYTIVLPEDVEFPEVFYSCIRNRFGLIAISAEFEEVKENCLCPPLDVRVNDVYVHGFVKDWCAANGFKLETNPDFVAEPETRKPFVQIEYQKVITDRLKEKVATNPIPVAKHFPEMSGEYCIVDGQMKRIATAFNS